MSPPLPPVTSSTLTQLVALAGLAVVGAAEVDAAWIGLVRFV